MTPDFAIVVVYIVYALGLLLTLFTFWVPPPS